MDKSHDEEAGMERSHETMKQFTGQFVRCTQSNNQSSVPLADSLKLNLPISVAACN